MDWLVGLMVVCLRSAPWLTEDRRGSRLSDRMKFICNSK